MKLNKEDIQKVTEFHNLVVKGLNNGLTHIIWDGRRDAIVWVRKRLELWESFGRVLFEFLMENNYEYDLKELEEIAKEGYKKQTNYNEKT